MPLLMGYYRLFMADCKHFKFSRKKYSNLTNPNLLKNITLIQSALTTAKVAIYGGLPCVGVFKIRVGLF